MKILVTVGTTRFDKLIKKVSFLASLSHMEDHFFICQKADGISYSETHNYKECAFIDNIEEQYSNYDLIITHAGAGSIFSLLDHDQKTIIVPNLDRLDKHQSDIANYMGQNKFALVCWELEQLESLIVSSTSFQPKKFDLVRFFKNDEFLGHINDA